MSLSAKVCLRGTVIAAYSNSDDSMLSKLANNVNILSGKMNIYYSRCNIRIKQNDYA